MFFELGGVIMEVFSAGPLVGVIRTGLPEPFGKEALVETIFAFETRTGGEERIVFVEGGGVRLSSSLYGLKDDFFVMSCDGDNLLKMVGVVVVVFKSFFSASVFPMLLQVAASNASGDALDSVVCIKREKKIRKLNNRVEKIVHSMLSPGNVDCSLCVKVLIEVIYILPAMKIVLL